jgi:hypothetical protein
MTTSNPRQRVPEVRNRQAEIVGVSAWSAVPIESALRRTRWLLTWLGYEADEVSRIVEHGRAFRTFIGCPGIATYDREHMNAFLSNVAAATP